jgi:hypothetical protein
VSNRAVRLLENHCDLSPAVPQQAVEQDQHDGNCKRHVACGSVAEVIEDGISGKVVNSEVEAHAMASIITKPNGSGQSTGNNRAAASPRNLVFSRSSISPINSTPEPSMSASMSRRDL